MISPRPAFLPRWLPLLLAVVLLVLAVALVVWAAKRELPLRGYTLTGLILGVAALFATAGALVYSARKRAAQERVPGALSAWLAGHLILSGLALTFALLHAGPHLGIGAPSGIVTLLLLLLALGSGLFGLYRYLKQPGAVLARSGGKAPGERLRDIAELGRERERWQAVAADHRAEAGISADLLAVRLGRIDEEIRTLDARIATLRAELAGQDAERGKLRRWLWLHIPASVAMALALVWHIAATWSTLFPMPARATSDFQSAQECRACHESQYREWSSSMHALAMQSPVTDIQNRLVLALEAEQLRSGELSKPLVGDLCVRCHAPAAYIDADGYSEDYDTAIGARSRVSAEGVTCSVCHRVSASHACGSEAEGAGRTFRKCDPVNVNSSQPREQQSHYNGNNLVFSAGRAYHGPYGEQAQPPSVGNSYHRGLANAHFGAGDLSELDALDRRSQLCASCHSVSAHDPDDGRLIVRLQDTYHEWKCGRSTEPDCDAATRVKGWSASHACTDCHNHPNLSAVVAQVTQWENDPARRRMSANDDLIDRQLQIRELMTKTLYETPLLPAAEPVDGHDRPLPNRRRHTHAFLGVDQHLEPDLSSAGYPAFDTHSSRERSEQVAAAIAGTQNLMRIAAAIRIERFPGNDGRVNVQVANLATGHKLPAGFAFAREMWLEIAVSFDRQGENWQVLVGGGDGRRELPHNARLNKQEPNLRNYQAVLYSTTLRRDSGGLGREVWLQNQSDGVLLGTRANELGFPDRQNPIFPGEISTPAAIDIRHYLSSGELSRVERVRARLLFRALPPEFLEGLAEEASLRGFGEDAVRARELVGGLRIVEMAVDVAHR